MVIPVLPGLVLCYGAVLAWAIFADAGWGKWLVLGIATFWAVVGTVVKYAWPGRRMKQAGVPNWSILAGVGLGIVGFFVIPLVGLPVGFVAGIWLAEWARLNDPKKAWPSTVHALKATGLAMLVELAAGVLIAVTWVGGVVFA
jgi:uncharacterized protein